MIITPIGTSCQAITDNNPDKYPLILGGTNFPNYAFTMLEWYEHGCDGDAILHALTRAVQQCDPQCRDIMGDISAQMIKEGISDSSKFLKLAVENVRETDGKINHVSIMIKGGRPRFNPMLSKMRQNIATLVGIPVAHVTILATTSDSLDSYGQGKGISATAIVTAEVSF